MEWLGLSGRAWFVLLDVAVLVTSSATAVYLFLKMQRLRAQARPPRPAAPRDTPVEASRLR